MPRRQGRSGQCSGGSSSTEALIAHLKLAIEKLRRELYGTRSERKARLLDQMELQLEDLEAAATEDELAAENAAARTQTVKSFQRKRPSRKPFPDHLPRERVVIAAPESCPCCGSAKLSKLGEDITETLEVIPRQWKVIQTVREKFSCRECETISAAAGAVPCDAARLCRAEPAGDDPVREVRPASAAEPAERALCAAKASISACRRWPTRSAPARRSLQPLHALIEAHVLAAERLHGDDTTVPILAKGKTIKGHIWTYVRDDRPFGGRAPPAALYYASRDRRHEHPVRHLQAFTGILQADAYGGYNELYDPSRAQGRLRRRCAGPMPGGSSSNWPTSPPMHGAARTRRRSRRSRWRRSGASTRCSISSAASTALAPKSGCACARNKARLFWRLWKPGCASSEPACRARPRSPSRSTTCSSAGTGLPASSTMAGSA